MNPHGLTPVLEADRRAGSETAATLRSLAGEHAAPWLWPADPRAPAEWAKHEVAARIPGAVFWRVARAARPRHHPSDARRVEGRACLRGGAPHADTVPHGGGMGVRRHPLRPRPLPFGIMLDRRPFPVIQVYDYRLTERPAYQRTVMVSYKRPTLPGSLPRMKDTLWASAHTHRVGWRCAQSGCIRLRRLARL